MRRMVKMNYLIFWIEGFRITFKQRVEFKVNLISSILLSIIEFLIAIFFGYVFVGVVGDSLNWSYPIFILFIFLLHLFLHISGIFFYGYFPNLEYQIKTGDISSYFCKPGNKFLVFLLKPRHNSLVNILVDIVLFVPLLLYLLDFTFFNVFIGVILLFLVIILNVLFVHFLMSFSWIFLKLGAFLIDQIYWNVLQKNLRNYPFQMFSNNSILLSAMSLLPMYYVSVVLVPIVAYGDYSSLMNINYYILMSSIIVMVSVLIFNWSYGVKNYEAYG